ncbi:MAG TPA: hypothetical protein VIL34_05465 [Actinopolymorphaceae bacterium]|jgi:hypothetical protein
MRERYTYDIAISTPDGQWVSTVIEDATFSRDPRSIARSLLEQWIIDHQGRLPGGRVFVFDGNRAATNLVASVRIRVYRGDLHNHDPHPVAIAYLGHAESDYPRPRSLPRQPHGDGTGKLSRVRSRLRFPLQRPVGDVAHRRVTKTSTRDEEDDCWALAS